MAGHCFLNKLLRLKIDDLTISYLFFFIFPYLFLLPSTVLRTNGTTHCFSYIPYAFLTQSSLIFPFAQQTLSGLLHALILLHVKVQLQCYPFSPSVLVSELFLSISYICNFLITPVKYILI